jgi:2-phospho-L-lactate guanylyltransferase
LTDAQNPEADGRTAVIVPVKGENPKGRLGSILTLGQRKQLQLAMLEDTLHALAKAKMVAHSFVVSSDRDILDFVERFGARSVCEPGDAGVNSAVARALEATADYERQLIIPADLPLLATQDIKAGPMLAREGAQVVIAPSEGFDGTNLLLLSRGLDFPLHYDDDSFRKHFAWATAGRLRVAVYYSRGAGFDIDRPADIHRFFKYRKAGSTLTFLGRTLRESQRPQPQQQRRRG